MKNNLDSKKESPIYKFTQLIPQNGAQTVAITTSGGQESIFTIPAEVFNLSKSYLRFTATGVALAMNSNWFINDCLTPIRHMSLYTANRAFLADLNEVANMTKVLWKAEIPFDEYITYNRFYNNTGNGRYLRASNSLATSTTNTATAPFAKRYNGTVPDLNYLEPKYLEPGTINADEPIFNITLPLGMMKNTIFEFDKDFYFREPIYLRIIWNQSTRIAFNSTDITDPTAGRAILAANINISNLSLYLAVEKNQLIKNELQSIISSGLTMTIPYIYTNKINLTGAQQSVTLYLNRNHGIRLKKIFHSIFSNTETSYTSYDNSNLVGGNKAKVFDTSLNDVRLQDSSIVVANQDDYDYLKDQLNKSVIQTSDTYYYNWFWLDKWDSGVDLSKGLKWVFNGVTMTNTNYNHYTFYITEKTLTISSSGITVI